MSAVPPGQDRRIIVYPHYIDSNKTVAEGRRIPKPQACVAPNVAEMADCCKFLKIPCEVEDKHYPRDWFIRGRLRVELKNAQGELNNPEIPDRRTLLLRVAELVPKHPHRRDKKPQQQAAAEPSTSAVSGSVSSKGGKSGKKKGKK